MDLQTLSVAKTVDARGTACPGPLLESKRAMGAVKVGDTELFVELTGTRAAYSPKTRFTAK